MKKLLFSCATILAFSGVAMAADVAEPVVATYDWSGPYLGVHAGYLWGDADLTEEGGGGEGGSFDGFVGGAIAGYNIQQDNLVFGVEGDFGFSEANGNGVAVLDDYSYDLKWDAHVRGRVGYAADNLLFFVAGGLALADFHVTEETILMTCTAGTTYTGLTIGGGIDMAFSDKLIGRVEYLHDEFGKESYTMGGEDYTTDISTDTVRAALIYNFGN